jgi:hypothetical protein
MSKHHTMKVMGGLWINLRLFLTLKAIYPSVDLPLKRSSRMSDGKQNQSLHGGGEQGF